MFGRIPDFFHCPYPYNVINYSQRSKSSFDQRLLKEICHPLHNIKNPSRDLYYLYEYNLVSNFIPKVPIYEFSRREMSEYIMKLHQDQLCLSDKICQALSEKITY